MDYYKKYLKYKYKYFQLEKQFGGVKYFNRQKDKDNFEIINYNNGGRTETYITFINGYIIPGYILKEIIKNIKNKFYYLSSNIKVTQYPDDVDPEIPLFYFIDCFKLILPKSNFYIDILPEKKLYDNFLYGVFTTNSTTKNLNGNIKNITKLKKFLNFPVVTVSDFYPSFSVIRQ